MYMRKFVIALMILMLCAGIAQAGKYGMKATRDSCVLLVKDAVAHIKAVGKEKALANFSNPTGPFVEGENYLSIYDLKGYVIGHGTNKALIGKDILNLKDSHGKLFIQEFVAKANAEGATGWVEYHWTNPVSKKIEPKAAYFVRIQDMIVQAGYYK